MGAEGWVAIDDLLVALALNRRTLSREQLDLVVENNNKKRFAYDEAGTHIRAVQGHSQPVDLGYPAQIPLSILYHGTVEKFLAAIRDEGLLPGSRRHVHLSQDLSTARTVGERRGKPVNLTVLSDAMHQDGHVFYCAENGVWLTDVVPPAYLKFDQ